MAHEMKEWIRTDLFPARQCHLVPRLPNYEEVEASKPGFIKIYFIGLGSRKLLHQLISALNYLIGAYQTHRNSNCRSLNLAA